MSNCLARLTLSALCLLSLAAKSEAQTVKLFKDIWAGRIGSMPSFLTELGSVFVFSARASASGTELWVTDGTGKGTKLLKDIRPGSLSSSPSGFVKFAGKVYFLADDGVHGWELWMTDGTAAGTKLVADVYPGSNSSRISILAFDSKRLWFMAEDGKNGRQIFHTAGAGVTLTGKFFPHKVASRTISAKNTIMHNGTLVFGAQVDNNVGIELYGTSGGMPTLIKDINGASRKSSKPEGFTRVGNLVFFVADDGKTGREMWYTGGTASTTKLLQDILPGPASGIVNSPQVTPWIGAGRSFFFVQNQKTSELWMLVAGSSSPSAFSLKQINPSFGGSLHNPKVIDGLLYFNADDGKTGVEPWISDGTKSGTRLLKDVNPGTKWSSPSNYTYDTRSGLVFFAASTATHGRELWITDGKEPGTRRVDDVWPGTGNSAPDNMVPLPMCGLIFAASSPTSGRELWSVGRVDPPKRVARISFKRILDRNQKHVRTWETANIKRMVQNLDRIYQSDLNLTFQIAEIVDLVDPGIPYSWNRFDSDHKKAMETAAERNPAAYKWRPDAINVYLVTDLKGAGGVCSLPACPANDNDIIVLQWNIDDVTLAHEIGHYFGLQHTHANHEGAGCSCAGGQAGDCVWDTPDDANPNACRPLTNACHLANLKKLKYTRHRENLVRFNVMSYHGPNTPFKALFTCGQVERMDQMIQQYRRNVIVGEPVATISSVSPSAQSYPGTKTLKLTGKNLPTSGSIQVRAGDQLSTSATVSATSITANFARSISPGANTVSTLQGGQLRVFRADSHQVMPFMKKHIDPDKNGNMTIEVRSVAKKTPMFLAVGVPMSPLKFPGVGYTLQVNPITYLPITTNAMSTYKILFKLNAVPANLDVSLQAVEILNGRLLMFTNPIRIVVP